jgi:hypothetical protein
MRAYSMSTRHIRVFDLQPNGTLARQTDRVFCSEPGDPDGMKVDSAGNVYCGGSGGLYIIDGIGPIGGDLAARLRAAVGSRCGGGEGQDTEKRRQTERPHSSTFMGISMGAAAPQSPCRIAQQRKAP